MPYANHFGEKRDKLEKPIMGALRKRASELKIPISILLISGKFQPDLAIGVQGKTILFEVKTPPNKESVEQKEARLNWQGAQWEMVNSVEEALRIVFGDAE